MSLFVDTSVWSLALRRDSSGDGPERGRLREALASQEVVYTTGLVLQELLQGTSGTIFIGVTVDSRATRQPARRDPE
ncbi:MAG: hypothetical protein V3T48_10055 [Vicinamibacterales bacterium]